MPGKHELSSKHIEAVLRGRTVGDIVAQMRPDTTSPPRKLPVSSKTPLARVEKTWQHLDRPDLKATMLNPDDLPAYQGNIENLNFDFNTADTSGQNMVTIATQAICDHILAHSPVTPTRCYVEANLSGDKKASARSFTTARGKKVTAEVTLPAELVRKRLHCSVDEMCDYWRTSAIGGVLSGTIGIQGHFANGLVGVTRFEKNDGGDLYATVTLPGIMVGTVGGGTGLPTQNACLQLMNLAGSDHSRALAEVTAGLILGGELSIIGALAAGHFSRAHKNLARGKTKD